MVRERGPCRSLASAPEDYPIPQRQGPRIQDLEADWLCRLESPDVAHPRGAPTPFMVLSSRGAARRESSIPVAIALQSVPTSAASRCQLL